MSLIIAAQNNDVATANHLIQTGKEGVNLQDSSGKTAAAWASITGSLDVLKLLIDKKANLEIKDQCGETAVFDATKNDQVGALRMLTGARADVNVIGHGGATAAKVAAARGHLEALKILVGTGAQIDQLKNHDGIDSTMTPLMLAAKNGHAAAVKYLIQQQAPLHEKEKGMDFTALHYACRFDEPDAAKILLDNGANPYETDAMGRTPLNLGSLPTRVEVTNHIATKILAAMPPESNERILQLITDYALPKLTMTSQI